MPGTIDLGLVKGDAGEGVPSGGLPNQALIKKSSADYDAEWKYVGQSVNGVVADENGDIKVERVRFAENIVSESAWEESGEFIERTSGGETSISDGPAWLASILGNMLHTGYVPQSIAMTVTPAQREEGETAITATIDETTFVAYVSQSGTITLTYTTDWSANPALYGVTVIGTPVNGDVITIVYVKEERGTIVVAAPTGFKSTGWNLYNHTAGYARVLKYSTAYGFLVGGTYTALQYSATLEGEKSTITPVGGYFTITGDGYIWVTGGNDTDTYILMTWSDWTSGYPGSFADYEESSISLSGPMTNFPNGLMRVGSVYDEIDLASQIAYSRVERMAYSAANLAIAKASGRPYEYDEDYIYLARESAISYTFTLSNEYTVSDHGLEIFTGTTVPVYTSCLYGENLVDKLRHDIPNAIAANAQGVADLQNAIGIVINGNTASVNVASGQYVIVKNSTIMGITNGLYKYSGSTTKTAGNSFTSSELTAEPEGGLNALNAKITKYESFNITTDTTKITATNDMWARRCLKVATISIGFRCNQTSASWLENIANFNAENNPEKVIYFPVLDITDGTTHLMYAGSGQLGISKPTSDHYYQGVVTFVTAN